MSYEPVTPNVHLPDVEQAILEWWKAARIPERALRLREGAPEFVFYEGPPGANAPPSLHSTWPRIYKDLFIRHRTMKGAFVPRKAGWDCHGLPVEVEIEKKLGFTGKEQIINYGIERFNDLCRQSVIQHVAEYERLSERIAFWLDYEDRYQTMDNDYIESVWWSLAELYHRGFLYEADRVTPWCPRCETPLSDHEVAPGYRDVDDPSVTIAMPLLDPLPNGFGDVASPALAVWTTAPWTLVSNIAAAVHPDLRYALVSSRGQTLVIAEELVQQVLGEEAAKQVIGVLVGKDLVGLRYRPPFDYATQALERSGDPTHVDKAWRVIAASFVTEEEGTGIVHIAPAFGAEDLELCRQAGLPMYNPVDGQGRFIDDISEHSGQFVRDADAGIIERLSEANLLIASEAYRHGHPHCWRCDTPLLYHARTSWYIKTTAARDRLLSANDGINWIPDHIRAGRFGDWLSNNVDWSLSRYRFWGTPLPIWRCSNGHDTVVASRTALSELAGIDVSTLDLHRPYVDEIRFRCPTCGERATRFPDLVDVWCDSGAMPFAQYGYPRSNADLFHKRFPSHFIAEGVDQTRGWFYSLLAEGVLLFDGAAYQNVICHGHLVDEEGRKMSSSHGNVLDAWYVFGRYGVDALRLFVYAGGQPGDNRRIGDSTLQQVVRGPLLTLWNVYRLFVLYASVDGFDPSTWERVPLEERPALDRWMLSELQQMIAETDEALEAYDCTRAARRLAHFIDDLSNWYARRSRRRFWHHARSAGEGKDKAAAYWTLWTCLSELSKLLASFTPFIAEAIYRNIVARFDPEAPESVHLADFPRPNPKMIDWELASSMAVVRRLVSLGRAARSSTKVKVRQPLASALVLVPVANRHGIEQLGDIIADELNVKQVSFVTEIEDLVTVTLSPDPRVAGPAFRDKLPAVAAALAREDFTTAAHLQDGESVELRIDDGERIQVSAEHVEVRHDPRPGTAFAYEAPFGVALNLEVDAALAREGVARELIHQLQTLRRDRGLEVTDRVRVTMSLPAEFIDAVREHESYMRDELLLVGELALKPETEREGSDTTVRVNDRDIAVRLERAERVSRRDPLRSVVAPG